MYFLILFAVLLHSQVDQLCIGVDQQQVLNQLDA